MKLRLHANTLRLRLNRAEVARFASEGKVEDTVEFRPGERLSYSLEASAGTGEMGAHYDHGSIRVLLSARAAREWTMTDRTGVEAVPPGGLQILVEKDFQCLHGETDPDPDAYPNPIAAHDS